METFKDVINSDSLVLVDFYATWCQPCKMMHPVLEQVKGALGDKIRIIKIDVDKQSATANQPMEQREQKPNLFGLCRVATEEDDSQ
ncbi:MAG: thioredoxin family protein, partial [Muribaculaceae bacterium]